MRLTTYLAASGYKIVVIGGGSGGCAISHRCRKLVGKGQVAVIEPAQEHHYQPGYTLVGGGLYTLPKCIKPMKKVLHPDNVWIKQAAKKIIPNDNTVELGDGTKINYDVLIVAVGMVPGFDLVEGLAESLSDNDVCSIYRPDLSVKTYERLKVMKEGNAVFSLMNAPIKCSGAAQKICYLADEIFRKNGVRNAIHLTYNTHLPDVFDVPKYTKTLNEIVKQKSIDLRVLRNLKSVNIAKREAIFDLIDSNSKKPTGKTEVQKFDFLHVAPPFSTPEVLRNSVDVINETGFLRINKGSLQHVKYENIFGIGDCCGSPNKKTAAAVFTQMKTLSKNVKFFIEKKPVKDTYNCYSSCPLLVNFHQVVLAEFTPDGPLETLPVDQSRPRYISFFLKRYLMPLLYWRFAVKGRWLGPSTIRKILHLGFSK